jgi:aspartate racemase
MSRHIGILGCSAEGAALCYRTVCLEAEPLMGRHAHPEVTLHTICLADYMKPLEGGDGWPAVAELMLRSAETLKRAGADFIICPDNTIHQALPHIERRLPLPWLHIAEIVAGECLERGFRRVGLLGTRWLVDSEVYPEKLHAKGVAYLRPSADERAEINRIIMDELVCAVFKPEATAYIERVTGRLRDEGCDAVVLGCTELPLIIGDSNSGLPTLDSTRLLARAALRRAVQG